MSMKSALLYPSLMCRLIIQYGAHREEDIWKPIRTISNETRSLRCYAGRSSCVDMIVFEKADISCFSCADQLLTFQVVLSEC